MTGYGELAVDHDPQDKKSYLPPLNYSFTIAFLSAIFNKTMKCFGTR